MIRKASVFALALLVLGISAVFAFALDAQELMQAPDSRDANSTFPTSETAIKAHVQSLVYQIFDTAAARDFDTLFGEYLWENYNKFDDWEPMNLLNADQAREGVIGSFGIIVNFEYFIPVMEVTVLPGKRSAVAAFEIEYSMQLDFDDDGVPDTEIFSARARATEVFSKNVGVWKVYHQHFSSYYPNP